MKPLVSVVIPNYNYARYVGEAIESVEKQTYKPVEIIVVDNGSTDNSLEVLKKIGDRIRLVAQENMGQAGSRNSGIKAARGEFVAFLDADDTWHPEKLEKQMEKFSDPAVGLVYTGITRVDLQGEVLSTSLPQQEGAVLEKFAVSPAAVVLGGESTAVVRKSVLDQAGPFDPRLSISTGWDMWRRIASRAKIAAVKEPLVYYRQHGSNASLRIDIFEHDTLLKLEKFFTDPASEKVMHLKRRAYGAHLIALSAACFRQGAWRGALRWGFVSLLSHPSYVVLRVIGFPCRRLQARFKEAS